MKHKKKTNRRIPVFLLCVAVGLAILLFSLVGHPLSHFIFPKEPASLYIFPENPKQGDTVFVRVKGEVSNVTGIFEKSLTSSQNKEKLVFYKKGLPAQAGNSSEWISFLGIDADQEPGDYKISINASGEELTKKIKVALAGFSSATTAMAPSYAQTGITQEKAVNNIVKNDNPALKKVLSKFTSAPYFTSAFSFPLSSMEKTGFSFGRFISFTKYKLQHFGVDLKAPEKTDIYSVNDGKVVAILDLPNYGKTVIIDHGLDIFSLYLHLDKFKVSVGEMVKRGQAIGLSGDTGYVTAPHLHFSIRVGSSRVDPIVFIETSKKIDDNFFLADINSAFLNIINSAKK